MLFGINRTLLVVQLLRVLAEWALSFSPLLLHPEPFSFPQFNVPVQANNTYFLSSIASGATLHADVMLAMSSSQIFNRPSEKVELELKYNLLALIGT